MLQKLFSWLLCLTLIMPSVSLAATSTASTTLPNQPNVSNQEILQALYQQIQQLIQIVAQLTAQMIARQTQNPPVGAAVNVLPPVSTIASTTPPVGSSTTVSVDDIASLRTSLDAGVLNKRIADFANFSALSSVFGTSPVGLSLKNFLSEYRNFGGKLETLSKDFTTVNDLLAFFEGTHVQNYTDLLDAISDLGGRYSNVVAEYGSMKTFLSDIKSTFGNQLSGLVRALKALDGFNMKWSDVKAAGGLKQLLAKLAAQGDLNQLADTLIALDAQGGDYRSVIGGLPSSTASSTATSTGSGGGSGSGSSSSGDEGNIFDQFIQAILQSLVGLNPAYTSPFNLRNFSGAVSGENRLNPATVGYSQGSDFSNLPPLPDEAKANNTYAMQLINTGLKSSQGNPILILKLHSPTKTQSVYAVSGTPTGWSRNTLEQGSAAPLPDGVYTVGEPDSSTIESLPANERISIRLTPDPGLAERSNRKDIVIHKVTNTGIPFTHGCIGVGSWPEMQKVIAYVKEFYAQNKSPLKLTVTIQKQTSPSGSGGTIQSQLEGLGVQIKPGAGGIEELPQSVVDSLSYVKQQCPNCEVVMTDGATTVGHQTHGPGKPIFDLRNTTSLTNWVKQNGNNYRTNRWMVGGMDFQFHTEGTAPHWHVVAPL